MIDSMKRWFGGSTATSVGAESIFAGRKAISTLAEIISTSAKVSSTNLKIISPFRTSLPIPGRAHLPGMSGHLPVLALVLLCSSSLAQTSLVTNGDFELPALGAGNIVIRSGSNTLPGWTVAGTSGLDLVKAAWQPASGLQSISLNWTTPSSISQTVVTEPGRCYQVVFSIAAEFPADVPQIRSLDVRWNGNAVASVQFNPAGHTNSNMGWETRSFDVIGTGADQLAFVSTTTNPPNYGPALDNIRVLPNPSIANGPESRTLCPSAPASFSVVASGSGPFTYTWRKDSMPIDTLLNPSAATDTLSLPNITSADIATYDCIVTNACGSVTSNPATLTICLGDFNCDGGINGEDIESFFLNWESGNAAADINEDGGIDGSDVEVFFSRWEAGC